MFLPETRVIPFTLIRRERRLPALGEVSATPGSKLDPLDVIARATPPRARRALSLSRVLGVREADVPKRLQKQVGDSVEPREIIISKPINLGLQQLVYRAPGAGQIVSIQGSWMMLDMDGLPVDLTALYRGTVANVIPRLGAVVEGQGALIEAAWGSGKEGYGVLKMMAKTPAEVLAADALDVDARGTVLVAGAGVTEDALRRADSLRAHALIVGSLEAGLRRVAESLELPVVITEGFGRIPMAAPIFEMLGGLNGQEVAVNGVTRARGGAVRAEIFVPVITGHFADLGTPTELQALEAKPGARVRGTREPYLGRIGTLPHELKLLWTQTDAGTRLPSVEIEWQDTAGASGSEHATIPWTNLELIG